MMLFLYFNRSEKKILLTHKKLRNFPVWAKKNFLNDWSKKIASKAKTLKKQRKKTLIFFLFRRFYKKKNVCNKNCLFYAKFSQFEEFSIISFFFVVASSLSILCLVKTMTPKSPFKINWPCIISSTLWVKIIKYGI